MAEKILVIKLSALGDVVLATGAFRTIRERHADARIALLTRRPFAGLCAATGFFDEVLVDNRERYAGFWKVGYKIVARGGYDVVYDLQGQTRTKTYRWIARLFSPSRVDWRTGVESPRPPDLSFCHGSKKHFGLLPAKYVLLVPGCSPGHPYKKWPVARYRELCARCAERGLDCVISGTSAEAAEISAICRDNPHAVDFMDKAELADLPDLARGAAFVVGNDTGPAHMARIAGAKTVTVFSSITRNSAREAPNAVNLIKDDIADITVDEVLEAVDSL